MANIKKIGNIAKGVVNFSLGLQEQLRVERIQLCKVCPIAKNAKGKFSGWCRSANGGCGCKLNFKASEPDEECPFGAWGDGFIIPENVPYKPATADEVAEEINKIIHSKKTK